MFIFPYRQEFSADCPEEEYLSLAFLKDASNKYSVPSLHKELNKSINHVDALLV